VGSYRLLIKPSAVGEIEAIPKVDRARTVKRIKGLSENPRPPGCEKLSGEEKYRVRQGWYRIVYSVNDQAREVVVVKLGHRKDIYR
jgi:mRNA interferase RelE/StbE